LSHFIAPQPSGHPLFLREGHVVEEIVIRRRIAATIAAESAVALFHLFYNGGMGFLC